MQIVTVTHMDRNIMTIDTSIVIPVFKENEYLRPTIYELLRQSHIFRCEIILAEFNPDGDQFTRRLIRQLKEITHIPVRLIEVFQKGITPARHEGIMAADGQIICDFDADAVWNRLDALKMMLDPIVEGNAVMTNCDNIIDLSDVPQEKRNHAFMTGVKPTVEFFNMVQRYTNYSFGDPGTCFLKRVYEEAGGFEFDNKGWETARLTSRIYWRYHRYIKNVRDVKVIQSPRRTLKELEAHGQYDKAIRKGKIIDLDAFFGQFISTKK